MRWVDEVGREADYVVMNTLRYGMVPHLGGSKGGHIIRYIDDLQRCNAMGNISMLWLYSFNTPIFY